MTSAVVMQNQTQQIINEMQQYTNMYRNYYIASFFFKCIRNEYKYLQCTTVTIPLIHMTDELIPLLWKFFGIQKMISYQALIY